jgi:hypothetical protein
MQDKNISNPTVSEWDSAIQDARQKIVEGKIYLARIKSALKLFERKRAVGEPWPGTQSEGHGENAAT